MRAVLFVICIAAAGAANAAAQEKAAANPPGYDAALAQRLGADEYGMKRYVLALLKTGPKTDTPPADRQKAFAGHMANIGRLAKENKQWEK